VILEKSGIVTACGYRSSGRELVKTRRSGIGTGGAAEVCRMNALVVVSGGKVTSRAGLVDAGWSFSRPPGVVADASEGGASAAICVA